MITQGIIEQFYEDVEALGLKYPVAEIAKKTGMSKGQISQVLNRKLSPSEQLINKFYESFNKVSAEKKKHGKANDSSTDNYLDASGVKITLQDYINLLHRENDRLFMLLNSTLGQIHNDQQYALAYQKAWVEYEAEKQAKGDQQLKKELMYKMNKLVDGKLQGATSGDKYHETGK